MLDLFAHFAENDLMERGFLAIFFLTHLLPSLVRLESAEIASDNSSIVCNASSFLNGCILVLISTNFEIMISIPSVFSGGHSERYLQVLATSSLFLGAQVAKIIPLTSFSISPSIIRYMGAKLSFWHIKTSLSKNG